MTHPATCAGPVECCAYEKLIKPHDFPTLITYARCPACGYADVTVDYPDGTERRVVVQEGEGTQKELEEMR